MKLHKGDHVLVNVAPFIASWRHQPDAVPCEVLDVHGNHLRVCTGEPYREIDLWIEDRWVDRVLPQRVESDAAGTLRTSGTLP
jgi:hypothetical protein